MTALRFFLCAAETGENGSEPLTLLLQYLIYAAVIVVGILVLSLIKRKQKPLSHEELQKRLKNLSENFLEFTAYVRDEKRGQYDFFRAIQKLIFETDKLIYRTNILADKERDSAITNIALSIERSKAFLIEFKENWKVSAADGVADTEKLYFASEQIQQAIAAVDRILERDKLLHARRTKKNG